MENKGESTLIAETPRADEHSKDSDPLKKPEFRRWQIRTLVGVTFGYALFYIVRKNLSMAMPGMGEELHISKADLGLYLTLHGLMYGLSKFMNGMWADRCNSRVFMVTGLVLSVAANFLFGMSSVVYLLGLFWVINGWTQGMGIGPCCRLTTHWVHPKNLATIGCYTNSSHSIGAAFTFILCGYLVTHFSWRTAFFGPGLISLIGAGVLWLTIRDTPTSVGLPEIQVTGKEEEIEKKLSASEHKTFIWKNVFQNPMIWLLSIANCFVYILRFSILDWGPTLLKEMKGFSLEHSGWMVAAFEVAGLVGTIAAGWITDRFFQGRGARTCVFCMIFATISMFVFWKCSSGLAATSSLIAAGFFIYGPQALVGIIAANLATRRAASTAVGFTGLFAYMSTVFSGWGLGKLVQIAGWDIAFAALLAVGSIGIVIFIMAWSAKAHGYDTAGTT
jgi:sugar phosphate permease